MRQNTLSHFRNLYDVVREKGVKEAFFYDLGALMRRYEPVLDRAMVAYVNHHSEQKKIPHLKIEDGLEESTVLEFPFEKTKQNNRKNYE